MKYTNRDIIQSGEQKLIRFLAKHLDWDDVKQSIREIYDVEVHDNLEHKSGNIVIHNGEIAYQMDFDIKMSLSVLLDRNGESISINSPQLSSRGTDPQSGSSMPHKSSQTYPDENNRQSESARKASEIARMMSEINKQEGET